jgi:hypothetical protein
VSDDDHLRADQLYAFVQALRDRPPPAAAEGEGEGEGADPELARALRDLPEHFEAPLPVEHRLGPETVARLLEHTKACKDCRMTLLEDGPGAARPKTQADVEAEAARKEEERHKKVVRFVLGASGGTLSFVSAQIVFSIWRSKHRQERHTGTQLQEDPSLKGRQIDPLMLGGIGLTVVAAILLADAYVIARELWINFTAWKRAVPIIGKRWAEAETKRRLGGSP